MKYFVDEFEGTVFETSQYCNCKDGACDATIWTSWTHVGPSFEVYLFQKLFNVLHFIAFLFYYSSQF